MNVEDILRFLSDASISVLPNQLESKGKGKWRVRGLMPDEVTCMMLLIHDRKVGPRHRIKCCPVQTSTPEDTAKDFDPSRESSADGSSPVLPPAQNAPSPMDASSSLPPLPSDSDSSGEPVPGDGTAALLALGANLQPRNLSNVFEGEGNGNGMVSPNDLINANPDLTANNNPQKNNEDTQGSEIRVVKEVQAGITLGSSASSGEDSSPSIISTEESGSIEEISRTSGDVLSRRKTHNPTEKVLNVTEQERLEQLQEVEKVEPEPMDDDDEDIDNEIEIAEEAGKEQQPSGAKKDWTPSLTKKEKRRLRQAEAALNSSPKEKREGSIKRKSDKQHPTPDKGQENVTQRSTRMRTGASDKTLGVIPKQSGTGKNGGKMAKNKHDKSPKSPNGK